MVTKREREPKVEGVCLSDTEDLRAAPSHTWLSSGTQGAANGRMAPAAASLGPKWTAVESVVKKP